MKCVKNRAVQGIGTAAMLVLIGYVLWGAGWLVGHGIDAVRAWIEANR